MPCAALAGILALAPDCLVAHPEIENQIRYLTEVIEGAPEETCAEVMFQRGELFRIHGEWGRALADFERVEALDPSRTEIRLGRGRLFQEMGEPRKAVSELDEFLKVNPGNATALLTRARAYGDLKELAAADHDFAAAIECSEFPRPELYLERVRALRDSGRADAVARSLVVLDEGLDRLGPLESLQLPAIELERLRGEVDGALKRIDLLEGSGANAVRKLKLRGDVLVEAGSRDDAASAYSQALQEFSKLSPRQKNLRPLQSMVEEIESALSALSGTAVLESRKELRE